MEIKQSGFKIIPTSGWQLILNSSGHYLLLILAIQQNFFKARRKCWTFYFSYASTAYLSNLLFLSSLTSSARTMPTVIKIRPNFDN